MGGMGRMREMIDRVEEARKEDCWGVWVLRGAEGGGVICGCHRRTLYQETRLA